MQDIYKEKFKVEKKNTFYQRLKTFTDTKQKKTKIIDRRISKLEMNT